MSTVTLLSGGLDSCLVSVLIKEMGIKQYPLFINYGQLNFEKEFNNAKKHCLDFSIEELTLIDIPHYGKVIDSGLTNSNLDIVNDAFLPGRNFLFLIIAASFAFKKDAETLALGLLNEETTLFPDQKDSFLQSVEKTIFQAYNKNIKIITPLRDFYKKDVQLLAKEKGIINYYSCHKGGEEPCGECISCKEYI